ncbi:MAG: hypothetical protein ACKVQS_11035 [Fimbriimonadaceae bacterium]
MRGVLCLFVAMVGSLGFSCLWDRDTVAAELRGMPELQDVIAGRFERNPDLYYEMRLARIEALNERSPEDCFDAAVAFDRLGNDDTAINWILKAENEAAKIKMTEHGWKDFQYKRFANLGTFYIHRGLKKGDKGLADLKKGLGMIEQAVEINPDAHFGREKVQVALVKDLIWHRAYKKQLDEFDDSHQLPERPKLNMSAKEIREGLIGLMVLGAAWESPTVWEWLAGTLDWEDTHAAAMIGNRINELDSKFNWMEARLPEPLQLTNYGLRDDKRTDEVYKELRANGKEWAKIREEFMLKRLKGGLHPDVNKDFWNGYNEVPPITIKETVPFGTYDPEIQFMSLFKLVVGSCVGVLALVVGVILFLRKKMVLDAERTP